MVLVAENVKLHETLINEIENDSVKMEEQHMEGASTTMKRCWENWELEIGQKW